MPAELHWRIQLTRHRYCELLTTQKAVVSRELSISELRGTICTDDLAVAESST